MKKLSPTFLIACTVVTISLFVLLSMLFYGPSDYFEQGSAAQDSSYYGFRYTVASAFFGSFGIGAYVGWMIILAWAVIVFFREAVGDLAIRAISLAVVVVSGAALADLLGTNNLGGSMGYAVGTVLRDGFGPVLGVILIGAVFSVAMVLATDFGFVSYYKEARGALAIAEEEEEEETPEAPMDLISRMEQTVHEIEAEDEAAVAYEEAFEEAAAVEEDDDDEAEVEMEEEPALESMTPQATEEESLPDRPMVMDLRPSIEEEELDEELATAEEPETDAPSEPLTSTVGPIIETEPLAELSVPESELPAPEVDLSVPRDDVEEPAEEAGDPVESESVETEAEATTAVSEPVRSAEEALESVFDALVGSSAPDPREEELMRAALVGESGVVVIEDDVLVTESEESEEEEEEETAPAEEPVTQTVVLDDPVLDDPVLDDPVLGETAVEEPAAEAPAVEEPPAEEPEFVLDDAVYIIDETIVTEEEEQEVEEPRERAEEPAEAVEPAEPESEAAPAEQPVILLDDEIVIDSGPDEAEDSLLPFMSEEEAEEPQPVEEREVAEPAEAALPEAPLPTETEAETETAEEPVIPILEEVPTRGMFRSLFPRKQAPQTATVADPLLDHAAEMVIERNRASVVLLQRRLDIGYTRAARIIEALETEGLVGPLTESGSREILLTAEGWRERKQ